MSECLHFNFGDGDTGIAFTKKPKGMSLTLHKGVYCAPGGSIPKTGLNTQMVEVDFTDKVALGRFVALLIRALDEYPKS